MKVVLCARGAACCLLLVVEPVLARQRLQMCRTLEADPTVL